MGGKTLTQPGSTSRGHVTQPVCVGVDIRRWCPSRDRESGRAGSENKGTQQANDIPDWMHAPAKQLAEQGTQLSPPTGQQCNNYGREQRPKGTSGLLCGLTSTKGQTAHDRT